MRGDTSHSNGCNGRQNMFTMAETDQSISTKCKGKNTKKNAPAWFGSIGKKYSLAGVLSRCRVSISSGRVFFHVIQY